MFGSLKLTLIFGVLIAGLVGGFVLYYKDTQNRLKVLQENNAKLETANQINQETIAQQQADAIKIAELNSQLTSDLQRAEQYGDELRSTLNKHNLTHLANKKPGLIEQRMQNATNKLWDDLESVTGNTVP